MTFLRALFSLLRLGGFRRLFLARITSQGSDGVFQVALASHVIFNPEQGADARSIALAFGVVLLPYSFVGPFAGVLLDRWPRRRVIVTGQVTRAASILGVAALVAADNTSAVFYGTVLLVFSVNRFVLAGLSASLPHVVDRSLLVNANSVAPTCGSLAYLIGGGVGSGLRAVGTDLSVVLVAALGVAAAAWVASRLPFVGPDDEGPAPRLGEVLASVVRGFVEAARTLPRRARVLLALIFVTRVPMGFLLLQSVLLFRGPLSATSGGLGLGIAALTSATGFTLAAFVTPWLAPRIGPMPFLTRMLAVASLGSASVGWVLTTWSVAVVGFVVSFASQGVKITVDTLMQATVADHLLGRAFSAYDVVYNAGLVVGAAIAAVALPESGAAVPPMLAVGVLYIVLTAGFGAVWRRAADRDERLPLG